MSSTKRNKVKSFGDPSIAHGEMADRFLIVGAFNAPPVTNRVKNVISFLKMMQKTQTKNCKNYFFHSSKTRVISSQSIYNARNAKTTSDSSFFMKV